MNLAVLSFIFYTFLIVIFSYLLSIFVLGIAQNTKLSAGVVGVILLPICTSLPEVISAFFSSSISDAKYATYNMLGSNTLTQTALVFAFIVFASKKLYTKFSKSNIITTKLLVILSIWLIIPIFIKQLHIGLLGTSVQLLVFLLAYIIYVKKTTKQIEDNPNQRKINFTKWQSISGFVVFSILLAITALKLLEVTHILAQPGTFKNFQLSQSLVGTLFLAFATTIPEVLIYYWILMFNSPSIAFNGILGSDLFNIAILTVADIFVIKGSAIGFVYSSNINEIIVRKFLFTVPAYGIMLWLVSKKRKHNRALSILVALATITMFIWSFKVF